MQLPSTARIIKENSLYYFAIDRGMHLLLDKKPDMWKYNGQHCLELLLDVLDIQP